MTIFGRILCLSSAVVVAFVGTLLLKNGIATGSPQCDSVYEFPCEDGECIDAALWCDSYADCFDESDEKYCKKSSIFQRDPNKCPSDYFKCNDGPCIPKIGRCDDYANCNDSSDEKNCEQTDSSPQNTQALTLLAITCVYRNTNLLNISEYESIKKEFLQKVNVSGIPGNVYEATLLFQALQGLKVTLPGLLEFILEQQEENGSFGSILATYLALPVLSGRNFQQINEHCDRHSSTDLVPIEVLKNKKQRKMFVQYSLNYGYPAEVTETIQMQVAEGINFLDVMRLAQDINPKFRFMLDTNREVPVVYSIGGRPNDPEKGMFWTLYYLQSNKGDTERLAPYLGNIKELKPKTGDEFLFWFRSI